jgi:hypothetical protein
MRHQAGQSDAHEYNVLLDQLHDELDLRPWQ